MVSTRVLSLLVPALLYSLPIEAFHMPNLAIGLAAPATERIFGRQIFHYIEKEEDPPIQSSLVPKVHVRRVYKSFPWQHQDKTYNINYRVEGPVDGPPILLVHGFGGTYVRHVELERRRQQRQQTNLISHRPLSHFHIFAQPMSITSAFSFRPLSAKAIEYMRSTCWALEHPTSPLMHPTLSNSSPTYSRTLCKPWTQQNLGFWLETPLEACVLSISRPPYRVRVYKALFCLTAAAP